MEDLVQVLTKFHREVFLPDFERLVGASEKSLRSAMEAGFDEILRRFHELDRRFERFEATWQGRALVRRLDE